jgi:hypothetical protein
MGHPGPERKDDRRVMNRAMARLAGAICARHDRLRFDRCPLWHDMRRTPAGPCAPMAPEVASRKAKLRTLASFIAKPPVEVVVRGGGSAPAATFPARGWRRSPRPPRRTHMHSQGLGVSSGFLAWFCGSKIAPDPASLFALFCSGRHRPPNNSMVIEKPIWPTRRARHLTKWWHC